MTQTTGLYGFMQSQKAKTTLLFVVFMLACQAYAYALMLGFAIIFHDLPSLGKLDIAWQIWRNSTIEVFTCSLLWVFLAYTFQSRAIARDVGSKPVSRQEEPRAYNILENLCVATGLQMPKLRVIETASANAFTQALGFGGPQVTVTRGLLNILNDAELEAAFAHEVARIRNGDSTLIGFAMIFSGMIFRVFEFFIRPLTSFNLRTVFFLIMVPFYPLPACIVLGIVIAVGLLTALTTRFAISQNRIMLADAGAVDLTKNPRALASLLLRLQNGTSALSHDDLINALCIYAPDTGWLASHPSILTRIETIFSYSGEGLRRTSPAEPQRAAFKVFPLIKQMHSSGFGASTSHFAIVLPVILAFVGQSWLLSHYGNGIGLVKPLDDSAYVKANPYRQATNNAANAGDVETQRKCFYNTATGYITEGNTPVEPYKVPDANFVNGAAPATNAEFSTNRQYHIAGNGQMAVVGPQCAAGGCDSATFDLFARATFAYYISAQAITTSFQQKSGAAGLAYAHQYLNSPADLATRQFIKLATDRNVITEFKFSPAASRLLLNDFANYRACTVEDAKAVDAKLLDTEMRPDGQTSAAMGEGSTFQDQTTAVTQMARATAHRQRMNFPLVLGMILLAIGLIWKGGTLAYRFMRGTSADGSQQTIGQGARMISPVILALTLLLSAFPNVESLLVANLGGPAPQSEPTDVSITEHSSMQDRLDAQKKTRTELVAQYAEQLPAAIAKYNSEQPADSDFRIPMDDEVSAQQPQIAVQDIAKMEDSLNCVFDQNRGYMAYGTAPVQKITVSAEDIIATVERSFRDQEFYNSDEYRSFHENLLQSDLGQTLRDHAYAMMEIGRTGEKCSRLCASHKYYRE
jgi:heat shock protein HtpX